MIPKILIVEDEETIAYAMKSYLTVCGYDVECARELEEAEAMLAAFHYDLVIADLRLSGIGNKDGLEVLNFLRSFCPTTRSILLTAYKTPKLEIEARQRGASVVLSKPQPLARIEKEISNLLQSDAALSPRII